MEKRLRVSRFFLKGPALKRSTEAQTGSGASVKFERSDARVPDLRSLLRIVLVGVPESTIVDGIDGQARVTAPLLVENLIAYLAARTSRRNDALWGFERTQRIRRNPARVGNRGVDGSAGLTIADRDVTRLVLGNALYPTVRGVGLISTFLIDGRCEWSADFVPADRGNRIAGRRAAGMSRQNRLIRAEIPIWKPAHQSIAPCPQRLVAA